MANIHTPERLDGESRDEYKMRRADARSAVREMVRGPSQAPAVNALDVSRFFLGQHTNPMKNRLRKLKAKIAAERRRKGLLEIATPKPLSARIHKQHKHAKDSSNQAFTLIGRDPLRRIGTNGRDVRRVWLGGISAQRGY